MIKNLLTVLIRSYQVSISPLLGPTCRFYPSCSDYVIQAICEKNTTHGFWLAAKRVLRCHPFSLGGYDPVPGVEQS